MNKTAQEPIPYFPSAAIIKEEWISPNNQTA